VRHPERPAHVHLGRRQLLVERDLEEGSSRRQRRVVDDQPDVQVRHLGGEQRGRVLAREIERQAARLHAGGAGDLPRRRLQRLRPPRHQHQIQPAPRQLAREGFADAFGGARDQGPGAVALGEGSFPRSHRQ
jgi:hypothetical protein